MEKKHEMVWACASAVEKQYVRRGEKERRKQSEWSETQKYAKSFELGSETFSFQSCTTQTASSNNAAPFALIFLAIVGMLREYRGSNTHTNTQKGKILITQCEEILRKIGFDEENEPKLMSSKSL